MKRFFFVVLTLVALTSCSFIRIDTKALIGLLEDEGVDMNASPRKAVSPQGPAVTEVRDGLPEFTGIESAIPVDIEYSQGEQFVSITAPNNIMPYISTEVVNGTLKIKFSGARIRNAKDIDAVIRTPDLRFVELNGAGDIKLKGRVETEEMDIAINGAGDVDIDDLAVKSFQIDVNGAGDIEIDRIVCESFGADISGAGDLSVEGIEAGTLRIGLSGAGDCTLAGHVGDADFSLSGAGSIDVRRLRMDRENSNMNGFAKIIR